MYRVDKGQKECINKIVISYLIAKYYSIFIT